MKDDLCASNGKCKFVLIEKVALKPLNAWVGSKVWWQQQVGPVENPDLMAFGEQALRQVRTDEAGTTQYQTLHCS
jgi:hypothetical protein